MFNKSAAVLVGLLIMGAVVFYVPYCSSETKEFIITGGERTETGFLIYTQDETLKNKDTLWYLKYSSSDVQREALAVVGKSVYLKVYGYRIPFFSRYRNVVKILKGDEPRK